MINKVYIVHYSDYYEDIHRIDGVFSTKEKAKTFIQESLDNMSDELRAESTGCYCIQEYTVR